MSNSVPVGMAARLDDGERLRIVEEAARQSRNWLAERIATVKLSLTEANERFDADFDVWMRLLG